MSQRIMGFDIARSLAIFGMVFVNFKIVLYAEQGSQWLGTLVSFLEGRASALFVVLAGIGLALMTNKARLSQTPKLIQEKRWSIIKRGLLLIMIGLAYTPIWPADILHFYGFYFLIAAFLFTASERTLWLYLLGFVGSFLVLFTTLNYDQHWDWETLTYHHFWTIDGMIRHIFFNGFHPVIPWAAFLLLGLYLGRLDLTQAIVRHRILLIASIIYISTEGSSYLLTLLFPPDSDIGVMLDTQAIPPMPLYMLAAASLAVITIIGCIQLSLLFPNSRILYAFYVTGQFALTLYMAHVLIGMGILEAFGFLAHPQSIDTATLSALIFCIGGVAFSLVWHRCVGTGPLEKLFRVISR